MKIAVIGANGKEGQLIVKESIAKGLDVTGIIRSENKSLANKIINKDIFNLTSDDLKEFDVIVDSFGAWTPDTLEEYTTHLQHINTILNKKKTRLIVVGGAGSLYMNKEHTKQLKDQPDFLEIYKPVANSASKALDYLRTKNDIKWTYISPASEFIADGKRTGKYILAGEEFEVNDDGESKISYADYAIALVDEIINGNHINERISVLS